MADEEPTARITLTTVYKELQDLTQTVNQLVVKLPNHVENTDTKILAHDTKLGDHERRIRTLETRMWAAVGAFGLIAAASPYLSRIFIP